MTNSSLPFVSWFERDNYFDDMIERLDLKRLWGYVEKNNVVNKTKYNLPNLTAYHTTEHMKEVACIASSLLHRESNHDWQIRLMEYPLVVACLFHDMNHSLGKYTDDVNINHALVAFNDYLNSKDENQGNDKLLFEYHDQICALIRCTQFPFHESRNPTNLMERCIRDADILYGLQDDAMPAVVIGLLDEVNVRLAPESKYSTAQWVAGRIEFLLSCEMFTETANKIFCDALSTNSPNYHGNVLQSFLEMKVRLIDVRAGKLRGGDVIWTDTENDSTYRPRQIRNIGNEALPDVNVYFTDGQACGYRSGETVQLLPNTEMVKLEDIVVGDIILEPAQGEVKRDLHRIVNIANGGLHESVLYLENGGVFTSAPKGRVCRVVSK
ncbi:hypothetical protein pEaSNUABM25_00307 [Erwinia phage pEa_SNUABM_25]|nr:hypothetical protein pEaSNUABM25_00307 [Erwinia phage pEa_SNUABM_25]